MGLFFLSGTLLLFSAVLDLECKDNQCFSALMTYFVTGIHNKLSKHVLLFFLALIFIV